MRRGQGDPPPAMPEESLEELLSSRLRGDAVVVGIGNPQRGDDVAGSLVARLLMEAQARRRIPGMRVIDAEDVPEAFLGPITRPTPDAVVLVDAVELGEAPGAVALLEVEEMAGREAFTHSAPLALLARYVREETGADVFVLGIQPGRREAGALPGSEIVEAAGALARLLDTHGPRSMPC
jgi:hydrogenase 3 maturation protease